MKAVCFLTEKIIFTAIFFLILSVEVSLSQDSTGANNENTAGQTDVKDILHHIFGKKASLPEKLAKIDIRKNVSVSILPGISYNPATSFLVGVSASVSWFTGDPARTTNSYISSGISYSVMNQFKLSAQTGIFTENNKWSLQGDFRLWKFTQNTYGLGTGTLPDAQQNMEFKFIRFNQNILKKIFKNFYAGLGYSLESYYSINTIDSDDKFIYPNIHNTYSSQNGFDSLKYLSSGIVINVNYDSRDNTVNTYNGYMLGLQYYNYSKAIGSTRNSQRIVCEFRGFRSFNEKNSNRLALWFMGNIILNGSVPYMSLPASSWDKNNAMSRGYIQGRFRGRNLLYAEIENRINITSNGLLGLVFFANALTISNPDAGVKLFDYVEPAGGVGLRIKLDKNSRTNICVDYGIGNYNSRGVFLTLGEVF
ncbi:MAG: hypothetical protein NTV87_07020 [Ignavibacteriae bacterium]|nr:hypothetical protein [Ignavibacteriota bacterium]